MAMKTSLILTRYVGGDLFEALSIL